MKKKIGNRWIKNLNNYRGARTTGFIMRKGTPPYLRNIVIVVNVRLSIGHVVESCI